jgi:hypothetical protein
LDDRGRIGQPQRLRESAGGEERAAGAETTATRLTTTSSISPSMSAWLPICPPATSTSRSPANSLAAAIAFSTPSTNVNGAVAKCSQSVGGRWVTTKTCSPAAGLPFQPFVRSNSRRPITFAAMLR